jgi:hypothetical protein
LFFNSIYKELGEQKRKIHQLAMLRFSFPSLTLDFQNNFLSEKVPKEAALKGFMTNNCTNTFKKESFRIKSQCNKKGMFLIQIFTNLVAEQMNQINFAF